MGCDDSNLGEAFQAWKASKEKSELSSQEKEAIRASSFEKDLEHLLNMHGMENASNTPDFILARYMLGCYRLFNATVNSRADWYGRHDSIGGE